MLELQLLLVVRLDTGRTFSVNVATDNVACARVELFEDRVELADRLGLELFSWRRD